MEGALELDDPGVAGFDEHVSLGHHVLQLVLDHDFSLLELLDRDELLIVFDSTETHFPVASSADDRDGVEVVRGELSAPG